MRQSNHLCSLCHGKTCSHQQKNIPCKFLRNCVPVEKGFGESIVICKIDALEKTFIIVCRNDVFVGLFYFKLPSNTTWTIYMNKNQTILSGSNHSIIFYLVHRDWWSYQLALQLVWACAMERWTEKMQQ